MTYKYKDLVVIPKSVLDGYEILKPLAKPLLPIVESVFDEGNVGAVTQQEIRLAKQEFITKGIDL